MITNGDWLTVSDAAKLTGYNAEYITRLIREKKIKARKVSIVWLVDPKSLSAYMTKAQARGEKRGRKT